MSNPLSHKRLAVLGTGKMGSILLRAFLEKKLISPGHVAATVRHAEQVIVLRDGRIVEQGTPAELVQHGTWFKDLFREQWDDGAPANPLTGVKA